MNWLHKQDAPSTLEISLANVTVADVKFIQDVVAIFTDPNLNFTADRVKSGDFAIVREPKTGNACVVALEHQEGTTIEEMLNFFASFKALDWAELKPHMHQLSMLAQVDISSARKFAGQILGYLPEPTTVDAFRG